MIIINQKIIREEILELSKLVLLEHHLPKLFEKLFKKKDDHLNWWSHTYYAGDSCKHFPSEIRDKTLDEVLAFFKKRENKPIISELPGPFGQLCEYNIEAVTYGADVSIPYDKYIEFGEPKAVKRKATIEPYHNSK